VSFHINSESHPEYLFDTIQNLGAIMKSRLGIIVVTAIVGLGLQACGSSRSPIKETIATGNGKALLTSAEVKTTHYWQGMENSSKFGQFNKPQTIICSEPSADVVKVFSDATDFGGSLGISGLPSGISPEAALAFSRARGVSRPAWREVGYHTASDRWYVPCL
jgi:uncharacterized membrane protein YdfJ with MMPL/SSD domain